MKKQICGLIAALIVAGLAAKPVAAADAFLSEYEDLPLAPGLTEQPGGMLFESATGRIVETQATGAIGADQVRAFYAQSLPQLGWQASGDNEYKRDKEILRIDVIAGSPTTVRFSVVPQ